MSSVGSAKLTHAVLFGFLISILASVSSAGARPPIHVPNWPSITPPAYTVWPRVEPAVYTMFRHEAKKPMLTLARIIEGDIPDSMRGTAKGLNLKLVSLLSQVESHFGKPVTITSGCRSYKHNRRVGGARKSFHLRCMAADIKIAGISESQMLRYIKKLPGRGGVGTYCRNSIVHVDVGPVRQWHQGCGKRKTIAKNRKRGNWKSA